MARVTSFVSAALLVAGGVVWAQRADDESPRSGQVGRYQLSVAGVDSDLGVVVLDTATGQCWRRGANRGWENWGNPTRDSKAVEAPRKREPITLSLPDEPVSVAVIQRHTRPIPGSDGRLFVRVGDITEGQALVSVENESGEEVLAPMSLRQGDHAEFRLAGERFYLQVRELRNLLIGDDFALCEISSREPERSAASGAAADGRDER
jgi:hypothetical protein